MPSYRFYCLNDAGDIEFADCVEANDDEAAVFKAGYLKRGAVTSKIWQGTRLVASLDHRPEDPPPA